MAIYAVLEPPNGDIDRTAFIAEGFSWGAFFLTLLWALWHRLWLVAGLMFLVLAAFSAAIRLNLADPAVLVAVQCGLGLLLGFEARHLRITALERAGYRPAALIMADSHEAAELTFFSRRASSVPGRQPAASRVRSAADDTLGIFGNV